MISWIWPVAVATAFGLVAYFNRDPPRQIPKGNCIVAPADGKLMAVQSDEKWHKLAIFLNLHNVHVQRIPMDGKVISIKRVVGGKLPAFAPDATHNNQVVTELETHLGKVIVKQMSGLVVRRIKTFVKPGEEVIKGQKLGRIMLGSRVELWLPADKIKVTVPKGTKLKAGESIAAIF